MADAVGCDVGVRVAASLALVALVLAACGGGGSGGGGGPAFRSLPTERIVVGGVEMEAWIAGTAQAHADGLKDATAADLAPLPDGTPRAMLFVFADAVDVAFWMRDTEVALDLAYADGDGTIVAVHDLVPLDETAVPSPGPVRYALEVRAGTLDAHGIVAGDGIVRAP